MPYTNRYKIKNRKLNCLWEVSILSHKGGDWVLRVKSLDHSHPLVENPFEYQQHLIFNSDYERTIAEAVRLRMAGVSHKQALNILPEGAMIRRHTYYNSGYNRTQAGLVEHVIDRIFIMLDKSGMHCIPRWTTVKDSGSQNNVQRLDALFFTTDIQIARAKRFASGFMIQVDATFRTNIQKMPLLSVIGITNNNATFLICLCFIRTENQLDIDHAFSCMKSLIWNDCPSPSVIITDQGTALLASVSNHHPEVKHQLCTWHMFQNIWGRICSVRKKASINDEQRQQELMNSIRQAIWQWIQCENIEKLSKTWDNLVHLLLPTEVTYIEDYWLPKTHQCLHVHTSRYRNLGCRSTQRTEGTHPALKAFMDPRHNLDEAVRHLIRHFNKLSDNIEFEENRSRLKRHHPLHLDSSGIKAFSILEGQVTLHCLQLLKNPWLQACSESDINSSTDVDINLPCNQCSVVLQYYLPCYHYLRPFAILREPIPLHLIHPRWHIDRNSWDPTGDWQIPINPLNDSSRQGTTIQVTSHIPDHRGQQNFVEAAYEMEAYLNQQPAYIAADRAQQFQAATMTLRRKWIEQEESQTAILPTPPVSFRTQFRTSTKRTSSIDTRRGLTGAEVAEKELYRQQVIDQTHRVEQNETQDVIIVQRQD